MAEDELLMVAVERLRVGLFIHLDVGWQQHPFPFNSFKIRSAEQIETLRSLGLSHVRYAPARSDLAPLPLPTAVDAEGVPSAPAADAAPVEPVVRQEAWRSRLAEQQAQLQRSEARYIDASKGFKLLQRRVRRDPDEARELAQQVVDEMAAELEADHEATIRLLSERVGDETSTHALNVSVLALLLARACEMPAEIQRDAAVGGLLHDIGKLDVPSFLHVIGDHLTEVEQRAAQKHVELGVEAGKRMGLSRGALRALAEHHERSDGSGYPQALKGEMISPAGRVVALVNHYENLVNPGVGRQGMTPHEALAIMFAKQRSAFDERCLAVFVRMMGIYPPGSVVELQDERLALVVSATPGCPLRPRVVVLNASTSINDSLILDINADPALGIRRSLRPEQVAREGLDHALMRKRPCYYFEPVDSARGSTEPTP